MFKSKSIFLFFFCIGFLMTSNLWARTNCDITIPSCPKHPSSSGKSSSSVQNQSECFNKTQDRYNYCDMTPTGNQTVSAVYYANNGAISRSTYPLRLSINDLRSDMIKEIPNSTADPSKTQFRFDLYKNIGIHILRADIVWADQELEPIDEDKPNPFQPSPLLAYMKLAQQQQNDFKFSLNIGAMYGPPSWFLKNHPDASLKNQQNNSDLPLSWELDDKHIIYPFTISYWYPNLYLRQDRNKPSLLEEKDDKLFQSLKDANLLDSIESILIPLGPAGEAIYPAPWTWATKENPNPAPDFWAYDDNAQIDFRTQMQKNPIYKGDITLANKAWGTTFSSWDALSVPKPGAYKGSTIWKDVLNWYRYSKNKFVTWQVAHYKQLIKNYYTVRGKPAPQLMLGLPGYHATGTGQEPVPTQADCTQKFDTLNDWQRAECTGLTSPDGDPKMKIMSNSEFLLDTAKANPGIILEWEGFPGPGPVSEVIYLKNYMKSIGLKTPMWAEIAGNQTDVTEFANEAVALGLYGLQFINSSVSVVFNGDNPLYPNAIFEDLSNAYSWYQDELAGNIPPNLTLNIPPNPMLEPGLTLPQNNCLFLDPAQSTNICMQQQGNLVLYQNGKPLWASSSTPNPACSTEECHMTYQGDGNLVLYNGSKPYWASYILGSDRLLLGVNPTYVGSSFPNDKNVAVAYVPGGLILYQGQSVQNQSVQNGNEVLAVLAMQTDGNLVYYVNNKPYWSSNTVGQCKHCSAIYQADGNLVVKNNDTNSTLFSTGTTNSRQLMLGLNPKQISLKFSDGTAVDFSGFPPRDLQASPGNALVRLTWTPVEGATSYIVKRSTTKGGPYTTIANTVSSNTYTDTSLINGTNYYYVVSASNAAGQSANSAQVSAAPIAPPSVPIGLKASGSNTQVQLTWTPSTGAGVIFYNVQRATTNGGPYTTINNYLVTNSSYTDQSVTNGVTYYYVISASNTTGQNANSAQVSAIPLASSTSSCNPTASSCSFSAGLTLHAGEHITIGNQVLAMQPDGNLVLYNKGVAAWASSFMPNYDFVGFAGPTSNLSCSKCYAVFQSEGNLVLYNPNFNENEYHAYWSSSTYGNPGATLQITESKPYISILNKFNFTIWTYTASGQPNSCSPTASSCTFSPGLLLHAGEHITIGNQVLAMQPDGNLVLYNKGVAAWASSFMPYLDFVGFSGPTSNLSCSQCYAVFQNDGNLVLYNPNFNGNKYHAYWSSTTYGNSDATLQITESKPYISILNRFKFPLWTS